MLENYQFLARVGIAHSSFIDSKMGQFFLSKSLRWRFDILPPINRGIPALTSGSFCFIRTYLDKTLSWCASLGQHSLAQNTELGKRLSATRGLTASLAA